MTTFVKGWLIMISISVSCMIFVDSKAQNWDINLLKQLNPSQPNSGLWKGFSSSAKPLSVGIPGVMLAVSLLNKDSALTRQSIELVGSVVLTTIATEAIKIVINRDRPYRKYPLEIFPYDGSENGKSFPSAHVSLSFATATSLALVYQKWYITAPAFVWAAGVGYSRLYQGEHYPSDVLTGAAVGIAGAYASHWLQRKLLVGKKKRTIQR